VEGQFEGYHLNKAMTRPYMDYSNTPLWIACWVLRLSRVLVVSKRV